MLVLITGWKWDRDHFSLLTLTITRKNESIGNMFSTISYNWHSEKRHSTFHKICHASPCSHTATIWNSGSPSSWCGMSISCQEDLWPRTNVQTLLPLWEFQEWQATPSNVKLSRSTIARAHSRPQQTCSNTQKQWQSIILVWHDNILPGRLVAADKCSNLVSPLRVSIIATTIKSSILHGLNKCHHRITGIGPLHWELLL